MVKSGIVGQLTHVARYGSAACKSLNRRSNREVYHPSRLSESIVGFDCDSPVVYALELISTHHVMRVLSLGRREG